MPQQDENIKEPTPIRDLPFVPPGATPFQLLQAQQQREIRNGQLTAKIAALKLELEKQAEPLKKKVLTNGWRRWLRH